jgi:hypothetical protein
MIQPAQVPHGALHVLIDSTGLQVYGAGQWQEAKHGAKSPGMAQTASGGRFCQRHDRGADLTDQDADDPA